MQLAKTEFADGFAVTLDQRGPVVTIVHGAGIIEPYVSAPDAWRRFADIVADHCERKVVEGA